MFEDRTYENLMKEALALVTEDVDKQEGSMIRTAISPCIYKLAENYIKLDNFIDLVSGDSAIGEYLDRVVADYGLTRKTATYAVRKIVTTGEVNVGSRWSLNEATYKITALLNTNVYSATCEQSGIIGNAYSGALEALDDIGNITGTLTDIITAAEDEESDDNLRSRFYNRVQEPSTSGNEADYKKWALDVIGCGNAKVFPIWNGPGTVKVIVVDEKMMIDSFLPAKVASYIETVRPIGATVMVDSPKSKVINITANVRKDGSKTLAEIQTAFTSSLAAYFKTMIFNKYSVSYAMIGSLLLGIDGVQDYASLLVNNCAENIIIADTEMPLAGTIVLSEAT